MDTHQSLVSLADRWLESAACEREMHCDPQTAFWRVVESYFASKHSYDALRYAQAQTCPFDLTSGCESPKRLESGFLLPVGNAGTIVLDEEANVLGRACKSDPRAGAVFAALSKRLLNARRRAMGLEQMVNGSRVETVMSRPASVKSSHKLRTREAMSMVSLGSDAKSSLANSIAIGWFHRRSRGRAGEGA